MDRFAVIGLGRFGSRLAKNLASAGAEVIAIDRNRSVVEELRDQVTLAIALDATDEQALRVQGVDQVGTAIVGIGHNFEAAALTTVLLKSLRVERVITRAGNAMQARILSRIGADGVVSPEDESADRWSHRLLTPFTIDHVELGEGYALVQIAVPSAWTEKTLAELDLRKQHQVTVVAIKRQIETASPSGADTFDEIVVDVPLPTSRLGRDDTLVLAGFDRDLEKLPR
ncbi:MAG: TrkA family potassium uptake protein [Planctomycetota bacterium]